MNKARTIKTLTYDRLDYLRVKKIHMIKTNQNKLKNPVGEIKRQAKN